ncbi:MAG: hypothetical protein OHK0021_15630 [Bryobacter sp.]
MNFPLWRTQVQRIVALEWAKTLFSRRGLWVYALALLPALLLGIKSYSEQKRYAELAGILEKAPKAPEVTNRLRTGIASEEVANLLRERNVPFQRFQRGKREFILYSDGVGRFRLIFREGKMSEKANLRVASLGMDIQAYAGIFQFFYLRLAIFFGCVGIFMNLFRGEMMDQSLHFYLLSPMRREVLLMGKYLAGLLAAILIFGVSFLLQYWLLLSPHPNQQVSEYLSNGGWGHVAQYLGAVAMAVVGYGSVFLAAGLFFRNPLIPAAVMLMWEGANWFLPEALQKLSVIYYLQSICPVVAPPNADIPEVLQLLAKAAAPTPGPLAVAGILALAAAILVLASRAARRLEINYSSE